MIYINDTQEYILDGLLQHLIKVVQKSIAFTDSTGNAGVAVTSGSGSVTFDKTAPTLSSVSIASNRGNGTRAT